MKKAILLVRVSTEYQSFDEQEKLLFNLAKSDGYAEENIIAIAEKESGIKLKEEERKGLNRMKELISNDSSIDSVYIYHIDRLSRRKTVLFSIVEYLQANHIQLVVKDPEIRLFENDGRINDMADIVFSLFATLAESEMRIKKERFRRSKDKNKLIGKYNGATLPFGYCLDENKFIIPDENNSKLVQEMYDMFVNKHMSLNKIQKELKYRGIIFSANGVRTILKNPINIGEGDYKLTPIIDKETYDKAQLQFQKNIHEAPKKRYPALCYRLIKCSCGHSWTRRGKYYCCCNKECNNRIFISYANLDRFIWDDVSMIYANEYIDNRDSIIKEYKDEINRLEQRNTLIQSELEKIDKKIDDLTDLFIDGVLTKDKLNSKIKQVKESRLSLEDESIKNNIRINELNDFINDSPDDSIETYLKKYDDIISTSKEQMEKIAAKVIDHIEITGTLASKHIIIYHKNKTIRQVDYNRTKCGCKFVNDEVLFCLL